MACVPGNRIATHPGALLLEQIREMGLTVNPSYSWLVSGCRTECA